MIHLKVANSPVLAWYSLLSMAIWPTQIGLSIWLERWQEHNNR